MKIRDTTFFMVYGAVQIAHFALFIACQCVYPATTSVALTLAFLAAMLGFSPLALHSPSDDEWTPIFRPRMGPIPWAVFILGSYAVWALCVAIYYVLLLTLVETLSAVLLVAYAASAVGVSGAVTTYAALIYLRH